jgi:putative membrane protein insertion efficiency factor
MSRLKPAIGLAVVLCICALGVGPVQADDVASVPMTMNTPAWGSPIRLFQKFISKADGDRCAMYPGCSHYAAQAFEQYGVIKGWLLTSDRLMRCGRDETRLATPIRVKGVRRAYDPLAANTFWWDKK